jgi:hypothetical protein
MNFFSQVTKQHRGGYRGGDFVLGAPPGIWREKFQKGKKLKITISKALFC